MRRFTAIVLAFLFTTGCMRYRLNPAPTTPGDDPAFSAPELIEPRGLESDPPEALALLPGDVVRLTAVSAQTDVYEGLIVDAMGQLHVPLAGDVQVGGLPLSQAEKTIEGQLRRYDRFVRVNLTITALEGHVAVVTGVVAQPGRVRITPGMRLADLLAAAGGPRIGRSNLVPTPLGNIELARLVRNGETVPVSVSLARAGDPKHNIRVRAGDQLFVPPITDELIIVLGEVRQPQPVAFRQGISLTEVLARCGGVNNARGDRKDIRIVRGPIREPRIYTTNLKSLSSGGQTDVLLAPGDIVYVSRAWYASTADVLNAISPIIALSQSIATFAIAYSLGVGR